MTATLVNRIVEQHSDSRIELGPEYNPGQVKLRIKEEKTKREQLKMDYIKSELSPQKMKIFEAITEQGASSWLNAMPLKEHNFYLDKQTFWDTIFLRYGIPLPRLPIKCVCNENFTIEHALNCMKGGFISMRHNNDRDFTANILAELHNDVAVEPMLIPLTGEKFRYKTANKEDHARLDVSARGFWVKGNRAFFDIKVF